MQYCDFIRSYSALLNSAEDILLGGYAPVQWPAVDPGMPTVVIFSPHPDDEILAGAPLATRFRQEGCRVINIAMTLGRPAQRPRRFRELEGACAHIGFEFGLLATKGFESVKDSLIGRPDWLENVKIITTFLKETSPEVIIVHHLEDCHPDHQGTALMIRDAIVAAQWSGYLFEAEYWRDMRTPNMMLEVDAVSLERMLEALSFHKEELERNPYHVRWLADLTRNVRRSEVVLGWGTAAPALDFATLYRRNFCTVGVIDPVIPVSPIWTKDMPILPLVQ